MSSTLKLKSHKVIIAGLDNAGKTSFLIALKKKYNFYDEVKDLKPTVKIDYSSFNFLNRWEIHLWDFGGQEKYRRLYLDRTLYFNQTKFFYYLIDIQDDKRFTESIDYLQELIKIYKEMNFKEEFVVCLNKFDPNLRDNKEIQKRIEVLKNIIGQIKDMRFKFFATSYYDLSSLSKALSYSLNKLLNLDYINLIMQNIVKRLNAIYAILYTESGIIISDYYDEILDSDGYEKLISSKMNEDLVLFQKLADRNIYFSERMSNLNNKTEFIKKYTLDLRTSVYIKLYTPFLEKEEILEVLKEFEMDLEVIFSE